MDSSYTSSTTRPLYRGTQIVWYILGILETLLLFRFVLKLLGANPNAGFTDFIYSITYFLASPFLAVFRVSKVIEGSYFEWATLLAMLVYYVIAIGIIKLFLMGKSVSTSEAAIRLGDQEL
jgi:uncharacterized protein YggT (Ycf19 family)